MRRFFGRKKEAPPVPTLQETSATMNLKVENMEQQIQDLRMKAAKLAKEADLPQNAARKASLKKQALSYIQRMKVLEKQLSTLQGQQFNLDQLAFSADMVQTNIATVNAMKQNVASMKKQLKEIKIDEVDDVMFDMEGMLDDANEISEILGGNIGEEFDDEELEGEWEALNAEIANGDIDFDSIQESAAVSPQGVSTN